MPVARSVGPAEPVAASAGAARLRSQRASDVAPGFLAKYSGRDYARPHSERIRRLPDLARRKVSWDAHENTKRHDAGLRGCAGPGVALCGFGRLWPVGGP